MTDDLEGRTLLSVGLDPTFGFGGIALLNQPQNTATTESFETIRSVADQSGKAVEVGSLTTNTYNSSGTVLSGTTTLFVTRLNTNGSVDTSFGTNGTEMIPIASGGVTDDVNASDIAVQSDGKIVVAGSTSSSSADQFVVARLNSNGSIDTTFGTSGFRLIAFTSGSSTPRSAVANTLAIGPDGKIVVAGEVNTGGTGGEDFAVARLNMDGSLDTTFNTTGMATVAFDLGGATGPNDDVANSVVVQSDSKIVVAGSADTGASSSALSGHVTEAAVARLGVNGTLDTSFNNTGKLVYTYAFGGNSSDTANALAIQGTQIVIAGTATQLFTTGATHLSSLELTVTRLTSNGSFDTSFNGTGKFGLSLNQGGIPFSTSASALIVLPDGSLLVGGDASEQNSFNGNDGILVRLTNAGALDASYASGGVAILPAYVSGRMFLQSDGKVVFGSSNGIARSTAPTPAASATSVITTGTGKKAKASGVTITFNTAVNPNLLTNPSLYQVRAVKGRKLIPLKKRGGVAYNPTTQTLTLSFAGKLAVGSGFQVVVTTGGIVGADGQILPATPIVITPTTT
jgi:uncharacterized delta-60 repeat protein